MRRVASTLLLVALALIAAPAVADDKDKFKLEESFKLIFNGKDLDGWKEFSGKTKAKLDGKTEAFKGRFKVKEGTLVIDPAVSGDVYIETSKDLAKKVHIKFDFKPGPKCNNDIFFQGTKFDIVLGKSVKDGDWHTFEIVASDDQIEHKINGKTARTTKTSDKIGKASPLRIRAEYGSMVIKNIRVKE